MVFMPFGLKITAFFMCIIVPLSNLFGFFKKEKAAEYSDFKTVEKEERTVTDFSFGKNDICVCANGAANAPGTFEQPLNSVSAAKALAQKRAAEGAENVNIWIREGKYTIDSPLIFNPGDKNISFKAYPGENVKFTGSVKINEWKTDNINGHTALSADIITGVSFNTLVKSGKTLPQTRYPETGYFYVNETNHEGSLFTQENTPWEWTFGDLEFTPDSRQEIKEFKNPGSVTLRLLHYWADEISSVKGYDKNRNRMLLNAPFSMKAEKGHKYYYENVCEALDKEGEWYLDSPSGKLYYIPFEGESTDNLDISYAVTSDLIRAEGCENLTFEGITFCDTDSVFPTLEKGHWLSEYGMRFPQAEYDCGGALEFKNCSGIRINNCRFENIGAGAVKFNKQVKNSSVTGCDFFNTGAFAVFIHGDNTSDESLITENITVRDNLIDGFGRYFYSAVGIFITNARNCIIENNEIKNGYYTAVSAGWVWGYSFSVTNNIRIRNNLIYNIGQGWLSDMGGIYTLGNQPGTEISGNVIHHVAADTAEGGYGGWGIYLDEGSQNIKVEKNLVYSCGSQSFHQHYGENNLIQNNIFALSDSGEIISSFSHGDHQTGYKDEENHNEFTLKRNIILTNNTPAYVQINNRSYTDIDNIYRDLKNGKNVFCAWHSNDEPLSRVYAAQMNRFSLFNRAVTDNPQFRDAENYDFTLPDSSPALEKIGFEKWDYGKAGTLTKHSRQTD